MGDELKKWISTFGCWRDGRVRGGAWSSSLEKAEMSKQHFFCQDKDACLIYIRDRREKMREKELNLYEEEPYEKGLNENQENVNATRVNASKIDVRVAELQKESGPSNFGGSKAGFWEEFESLQQQCKHLYSRKEGQRPENKAKNRYKNILPFDHTRVVLRGMGEKPGDDYINANYIHHEEESLGGGKPYKQYIATQGCVGGTRGDFYHMIWQERSLLVVMTTKVMERGKTKCARYWPEVEQTEEYGGYTVTNLTEETSKDYTLREFKVSKGDESRRVFHYHFLGWPDHGTPEDPGSVLNFLHDVNIKQESLGNKIIVDIINIVTTLILI